MLRERDRGAISWPEEREFSSRTPPVPLVERLCVVDTPVITELVARRPTAERPPTATDFDRPGVEPLDTVPLLEAALLLGGGGDAASRSRVCIASW